jgi:very-short-patch-repair endonuclease
MRSTAGFTGVVSIACTAGFTRSVTAFSRARRGGWRQSSSAGQGRCSVTRSAAALWRIRDYPGREIEVTEARKSRSRGGIERHYAVLPDDEVTIERGVPVTSVPRTIFDLAATQSADAAEGALRQAEYLRLHDRLSLSHLLERYPRRQGAKAVRDCLAHRREVPGRTRSWLEERFLPFLRREQLPLPQLNAWLEVGGRRYQVDCLWLRQQVVIELDGFAAHGTRIAFREDRARDRRLRVAGYGVTRVAPEQLEDEPETLAADLRVLLNRNTNVRDNVHPR